MEGIRQYIFSVICCAIICSVIPLLSGGSGKKVLRLVCGIYLTVTVVAPILRIDMEDINAVILPSDAKEAAAAGEHMARESMASLIKQECEAYILDKANELGLALEVSVVIGEGELPVPAGARIKIHGEVLPEQQRQLKEILGEELGIPEEEQQWIG